MNAQESAKWATLWTLIGCTFLTIWFGIMRSCVNDGNAAAVLIERAKHSTPAELREK